MSTFRFFVPGPVVGQGRPRASRTGKGVRMYDPEKSVNYKAKVSMYASAALREQCLTIPFKADGKGFSVYMDAAFLIPKSYSKKKRQQAINGEIKPKKKPDCDNIIKGALDALNGILWHDDAEVTTSFLTKYYTNSKEGLSITVMWDEEE